MTSTRDQNIQHSLSATLNLCCAGDAGRGMSVHGGDSFWCCGWGCPRSRKAWLDDVGPALIETSHSLNIHSFQMESVLFDWTLSDVHGYEGLLNDDISSDSDQQQLAEDQLDL